MSSTHLRDNLRYHRHLNTVTKADVEYVATKDAQYDASWKKRGGRGAWFTIVRPWDRLESMLKRLYADDVFFGLNHEGLTGPDGSLIACVRDLRRYLLLLECEMMEQEEQRKNAPRPLSTASFVAGGAGTAGGSDASGTYSVGVDVVQPGSDKTVVTLRGKDRGVLDETDHLAIEKRLGEWVKDHQGSAEDGDIYSRMAEDLGVPRHRVKATLFLMIYGGRHVGETIEELGKRVYGEQLAGRRDVDGSQHAASYPFVMGWGALSRMGEEMRDVWEKRGPGMFVIEYRISPEKYRNLSPNLRNLFLPVYRAALPTDIFREAIGSYCQDKPIEGAIPVSYWLDVAKVPEHERERWPRREEEQNASEWSGLMEFQELYGWHDEPQKFILREKHRAWSV